MHHSGFLTAVKEYVGGKESSPQVSGLRYIENWMDPGLSKEILQSIDDRPWEKKLTRRTQEYGFKYEHLKRRKFLETMDYYELKKLEEIPTFLKVVAQKLFMEEIFSQIPDQVIVNEYCPGEGIGPHIDDKNVFSNTIATLSLGSSCIMTMKDANNKVLNLPLKPNSLVILNGKARYECQHGIRGQVYDIIDSVKVTRSRRISLTFRKTL